MDNRNTLRIPEGFPLNDEDKFKKYVYEQWRKLIPSRNKNPNRHLIKYNILILPGEKEIYKLIFTPAPIRQIDTLVLSEGTEIFKAYYTITKSEYIEKIFLPNTIYNLSLTTNIFPNLKEINLGSGKTILSFNFIFLPDLSDVVKYITGVYGTQLKYVTFAASEKETHTVLHIRADMVNLHFDNVIGLIKYYYRGQATEVIAKLMKDLHEYNNSNESISDKINQEYTLD